MLHDVDVQDGLVYASWWNDGLVILDVGNGIKGGSPSNPVLVSQFKYDLDSLYARVALEGGPGFIRGTHTAWRHRNYVFIADEVFGNAAAQQLFSWQPTRAYGRLQVVDHQHGLLEPGRQGHRQFVVLDHAAVQRDPGYLARQDMEVIRGQTDDSPRVAAATYGRSAGGTGSPEGRWRSSGIGLPNGSRSSVSPRA